MRRVLFGTFVLLCLSPVPGRSEEGRPPAALPGNLTTDYSGVEVADPYRALEDLKAPATLAWASAQANYTRRQLDRLAGRKALLDRITALDAERSPVVVSLSVTPKGQWFYLKRSGGESTAKLYVRSTVDAPERVLLDPTVWQKRDGVHRNINEFSVAPDGTHVAALVSAADYELAELQVVDSASGEQVLPSIPGIWGELPAVWNRDSRSIETEGGHGVSSTAEQLNSELADRLAFILWNTGDAGFQPVP